MKLRIMPIMLNGIVL